MFNPLFEDASKLKDQDLDARITDLSRKYHIAARMGQGSAANQIAMALDMYRSEQNTRHMKATQKIAEKQNQDLDDLINVN